MVPLAGGNRVQHAVRAQDLAVGQVGVARGEGVGVVRRPVDLEVDEALSTSVAPGPNWSKVNALLFQKMLLNSAIGLEKSGGAMVSATLFWNPPPRSLAGS